MSVVHLNRIKAKLHEHYGDLITHLKSAHPNEEDASIYSKTLAGHALTYYGGAHPDSLKKYITDGAHDRGIDALYYAPEKHLITLVQSKWNDTGSGKSIITERDAREFANGVSEYFHEELDTEGNAALKSLSSEIRASLEDYDATIQLVIISTSEKEAPKRAKRAIQKASENLDDDVVTIYATQKEAYKSFAHDEIGPGTDFELNLHNFNTYPHPYRAWYGCVSGGELARLFESHKNALFSRNLRTRLGETDINKEIAFSAVNNPESFWYFNNGVTFTASRVQKSKQGGASRDFGTFKITEGSIVNGAQTTSSLYEAYLTPENRENLDEVKCMVRLIELPENDEEFPRLVTQYNNSQNSVGVKDFLALEPFQDQLRAEVDYNFARTYFIRSGENTSRSNPEDFDVQEATIALACAGNSVKNVVRAKSGISSLWRDLNGEPYTQIFDEDKLTAHALVKAVDFLRWIDAFLQDLELSTEVIHTDPSLRPLKYDQVAIHGNRMFAHLIMRNLDIFDDTISTEAFVSRYSKIDLEVQFDRFCKIIYALYPESYVARLFKNGEKSANIAKEFGFLRGV